MITVTLHEAKAKLNFLVDQAINGKSVVLMRGSKVVATILPVSEQDLELAPQLTDSQAEHFWNEVSASKKKTFKNAKEALHFLKHS